MENLINPLSDNQRIYDFFCCLVEDVFFNLIASDAVKIYDCWFGIMGNTRKSISVLKKIFVGTVSGNLKMFVPTKNNKDLQDMVKVFKDFDLD